MLSVGSKPIGKGYVIILINIPLLEDSFLLDQLTKIDSLVMGIAYTKLGPRSKNNDESKRKPFFPSNASYFVALLLRRSTGSRVQVTAARLHQHHHGQCFRTILEWQALAV